MKQHCKRLLTFGSSRREFRWRFIPAAYPCRWLGRCAPSHRRCELPSTCCPGASRQAIKRLQRTAVPASKLACTPAADPQRLRHRRESGHHILLHEGENSTSRRSVHLGCCDWRYILWNNLRKRSSTARESIQNRRTRLFEWYISEAQQSTTQQTVGGWISDRSAIFGSRGWISMQSAGRNDRDHHWSGAKTLPPFFIANQYFIQLDPDLSRGLDVELELNRGIEGSLDGLNPELFERLYFSYTLLNADEPSRVCRTNLGTIAVRLLIDY